MRAKSVYTVLNSLFSAQHEPVYYPPKRVRHKMLPVEFPTRKCVSGSIRCRSPLMADGVLHLDTDPDVVAISPYPLTAEAWIEIEPGVEDRLHHFADVAAKRRDGSVVFLKYENFYMQEERPWHANEAKALADYYLDIFGCAFRVLNEASLHIEPRFSNLRQMWQHREVRSQSVDLDRVRNAIASLSHPATIDDVWQYLGTPQHAVIWEGDETATTLPQSNPVFTAVMQLAMRGELRLDLGKRLTMNSLILKV